MDKHSIEKMGFKHEHPKIQRENHGKPIFEKWPQLAGSYP